MRTDIPCLERARRAAPDLLEQRQRGIGARAVPGSGTAAVLAVLSLALQACASPGSPATQTVQVDTPGCAYAACELRNDSGHWQVPSTPGAVTLTTSNAPLQVSCRGEDGALGTISAPASAPPVTGTGA